MVSLSFSLTTKQIDESQMVYNIGKNIKASDGMTFGQALVGQFGEESSFGIYSIGDKYSKNGRLKSLYDSSLGVLQVKLSTAKLTIKKYPKLYRQYSHMINNGKSTYKDFMYHKDKVKYYTTVINNPVWIKRYSQGTVIGVNTINWANMRLKVHNAKLLNAKKQSSQDTLLINTLINNKRFCAIIGGHYLLSMYEEALKKGYRNPWRKAIGRYNGGWNNNTYYPKVIKKLKLIKRLEKREKFTF